ncbi:hypothetical protein EVAR_101374_1, partial [Eumeta japonica]
MNVNMTVIVAHVMAISNVYPCTQCGTGATCSTVNNHRAVCECPKGYIGAHSPECRPECYGDSDCPAGRPACFYADLLSQILVVPMQSAYLVMTTQDVNDLFATVYLAARQPVDSLLK